MIMENFQNKIQKASQVIGTSWPLYSFVTSNPLAGFENNHFKEAIQSVKETRGARVFPKA